MVGCAYVMVGGADPHGTNDQLPRIPNCDRASIHPTTNLCTANHDVRTANHVIRSTANLCSANHVLCTASHDVRSSNHLLCPHIWRSYLRRNLRRKHRWSHLWRVLILSIVNLGMHEHPRMRNDHGMMPRM